MKAKYGIIGAALAVAGVLVAADIRFYLGPARGKWLTSTANGVSFSGSNVLTDKFDLTRDFYVELVMRLDKGDPDNPLSIGGFGPMELRYLRGPWQLLYSCPNTTYCFSQNIPQADLRWPGSTVHHVFLKSVNHVAYLYVDGDFIVSQDYAQALIDHPFKDAKNRDSKSVSFAPSHEIRLFRVGYLASEGHEDGEAAETVVANHYNGGKPLRYRVTDENRKLLLEIYERNIKMDVAKSALNGATMTPAKALEGTMSWRTDDVYAPTLTADAAPTLAPRYAGQRYKDTAGARDYYATGNQKAGDWRMLAIAQDIIDYPLLKANGVSLVGTGDVAITAEGYRNVEDALKHGATGDGETDDAAALQAALAAAQASGKALRLTATAAGVYRVSKPLAVPAGVKVTADPGVTVEADGTAFTIAGDRVELENMVISAGTTAIAATGVSNLRIKGVTVAEAGGDAISVTGGTDVWIEGCTVGGALGSAVRLANTDRAVVRSCCLEGGAAGVRLDAGNARTILEGNYFLGMEKGVTGGASCTDLLIAKNGFELCTAAGVELASTQRAAIRANTFANFGASVCAIDGTSLVGAAVTGNNAGRVKFTGAAGLALTGNMLGAAAEISESTGVAQGGNVVKPAAE